MEESDAEPPTMGRGTPPHPNRYIFKREMAATKLFLRDYSRRRGLGGRAASAASVSSVEVDISALQRRKQAAAAKTDEEREAAQKARATTLRTQGKMPSAIADKRRKQAQQQQQQQHREHRQHSKLMS